ncbi:MAG: glycosyltransferase [Candidatus Delongbacteria bacterium]|jgi:glycosyltransferase involved in cell wall biosynthesis|nr:glycosyltransferase [Candidatus Delongbacteria bacterium]
MKRKTIALVSQNKNPYSQTFVQAHKINFDAEVHYYYNGLPPTCLEGVGLLKPSLFILFKFFVLYHFFGKDTTVLQELILIDSFRKNKIEKVYAEFGPMGVSILKVCKKMGLPLIVNIHGYDVSRYEILEKYTERYRELFNYSDFVVVVSKKMKEMVAKLGADTQKIIYTPCAPDDVFYNITSNYEGNYFVSVGRFVDKKAPYYTILAFQRVIAKYPDVKLYIAGDGPLFNACKNLIRYFKLEKNIILLGVIKQKELLELYKRAIGYVQHSITADDGDMEGTPVSILEASAAGLPVISTKHAGITDVIIDGKTGLLVDEHDVDGMACNMIRILSNNDFAVSLGKEGKENIQNYFSMKNHIEKLNEIINN